MLIDCLDSLMYSHCRGHMKRPLHAMGVLRCCILWLCLIRGARYAYRPLTLFTHYIPLRYVIVVFTRSVFTHYIPLRYVIVVFTLSRFTHSFPLRYAFVEFTSEKAATAAVMGANGTTVKGREISVAISNPPKKDKDG
jgi:hypothetical protein